MRSESSSISRISPQRQATSNEDHGLRRETQCLKELVVELSLENRLLKKA